MHYMKNIGYVFVFLAEIKVFIMKNDCHFVGYGQAQASSAGIKILKKIIRVLFQSSFRCQNQWNFCRKTFITTCIRGNRLCHQLDYAFNKKNS